MHEGLINSLRICSIGGPCADCEQKTAWNCDWKLMEKAANAIEELNLLVDFYKTSPGSDKERKALKEIKKRKIKL